jgi:hypothetical protein
MTITNSYYKPLLTEQDLHIIIEAMDVYEENLQYNDEESSAEREEHCNELDLAYLSLREAVATVDMPMKDRPPIAKSILKLKRRWSH